MKLFFDIETAPADPKMFPLLRERYERVARETSFEQYVANTALDSSFGQIICIGYALDKEPVKVLEGSEQEILTLFWDIARKATLFIGHNIFDFDFRFIIKRSIVNQVRPSRVIPFARYRNNPIFDTMLEWELWSFGGRISLKTLAQLLSLPQQKSDLDAKQIPTLYKAGKLSEIKRYCAQDVEVVRAIYYRMSFQD